MWFRRHIIIIIKLNMLLTFRKINYIYIINNKGPNIDHCGTPMFIDKI